MKNCFWTALALSLLVSCNKPADTNSSTSPSVYIAGRFAESPVYWKNGKMTILAKGKRGEESGANSIFVSGSDIYVAGANDFKSVYWKNGTQVVLNSNIDVAFGLNVIGPTSIFVSGSAVYTTMCVDPYGAGYWDNGVIKSLPARGNFGESSVANSIFVSGSDIYVAGAKFGNGNNNPGNSTATYWKNGEEINIDSGIHNSNIISIVVSGNDVYAAGNYFNTTYSTPYSAVYWKNGIATRLDTSIFTCANSLAVSGKDVYLAGYEISDTMERAVYWKNGVATLLPGGTGSQAYSIYIYNTDVYVAGIEFTNTGVKAVYWKNDIVTQLEDSDAIANSIFVK
jgi:hypothetical protein